MVFITNDDIVEVSEWALKSGEIFGSDCFHEVLNPIFSTIKNLPNSESIKDAIIKQIIAHPGYIDLRQLQLTEKDL